ncbi:hypothetical protein [Simiduia agarivorans]|uniref:Uncharacterized protein n=1 Tax=Simiduia agarivorans (strain DSM 21679 / JCM 13881 / BCRC 17597 / SA1) TaxID=1117647 RepID=K4KHC1_SIMAS|nr:hypothetical protein [Simiduia agarivorans]AFU98406.1 hypothetical protein M5M_06045 [Simiduia agarivorans SA1 = DSM 21679]
MLAHDKFSAQKVAFIQPANRPLSHREAELETLRRSNEDLRRKNDELNEKLTLEGYFQTERETKFRQLEERNEQLAQEMRKLKDERAKLQSALSDSKLAQIKLRHATARATRAKIELNDLNRDLQQKIDFLIEENQRLNKFKFILLEAKNWIARWNYDLGELAYLARRRLQGKLQRQLKKSAPVIASEPAVAAEEKWFIK